MSYLVNYSKWKQMHEAANGMLDQTVLAPIDSISGAYQLNKVAAAAYNQMVAAAKEDGISWGIDNSYRDIEKQKALANKLGLYSQGGLAAAPGTSNHGWGSAIDLKVKNGDTAHTWLKDNAVRFGFSTIPREPWHWEHKASAELLKRNQTATPVSTEKLSFDDVKNRKIALRSGMTGELVSQIQSKLKELGLLTKEPNSEYDKDTYNAVKQFQTNNSLKSDGVFGHKTYIAMFEPAIKQVAPSPSNSLVNKKELYNYLKTKMSDIHSLGILANVQSESNFNSAALGDNGTSGGLFQHHATRFNGLTAALGQDNWKTNWKGQVDYALSEKPGQDYLNKTFTSPEQASEWWVRNFERPAQIDKQVVLRNANIAQVKQDLRAGGVQIA